MKIIKTSMVSILLLTVLSMAGGDIAPLESQITTPEPTESHLGLAGLYVGGGYTYMSMDNTDTMGNVDGNGIGLLAGYNFNEYFAVEGRFNQTLGDLSVDIGEDRGDLSNIALYLKPQYLIANIITLYGLLGYGQVTLDDSMTDQSESGFQYGAGVSIMATDNVGLYVDYTRLYDDDGFDDLNNKDISVDAVNIGIYYNF